MFSRKTLKIKINCYYSDQSKKKLNQVTVIQIVSRKAWLLMNYKELINLLRTNPLVLTSQKRSVIWIEKKWKSLLGENYLLRKPVHFSAKITANNAVTLRFIQRFLQHLYKIANPTVMVWFGATQIHRYRQQHIWPGRIQHSRVVLEHLVDKVKTAQNHRYRLQHISSGEVQHCSKILRGVYSLFTISLNYWERQGLKPAHLAKIHRTTKW